VVVPEFAWIARGCSEHSERGRTVTMLSRLPAEGGPVVRRAWGGRYPNHQRNCCSERGGRLPWVHVDLAFPTERAREGRWLMTRLEAARCVFHGLTHLSGTRVEGSERMTLCVRFGPCAVASIQIPTSASRMPVDVRAWGSNSVAGVSGSGGIEREQAKGVENH
jgi:hypothetical protein